VSPGWAAVVGVLLAAVPAFVGGTFVKRRTAAEATDLITQAAARVVQDLTVALTQAQATAAELRSEVNDLRDEVAALRSLILSLGGDPAIARKR